MLILKYFKWLKDVSFDENAKVGKKGKTLLEDA